MATSKLSVADRFKAKIAIAQNGCWLWRAFLDRKGYGRFTVNSKRRAARAHRISYEMFKGPMPRDLEIDHLCRTPACVNPNHLEAVSHAENVRRGPKHKKTHCKRGHALTPDNLVQSALPRERRCLVCHRAVCRASYKRRINGLVRCFDLAEAMAA